VTPEQFVALCKELHALGASEVRFGENYCRFTVAVPVATLAAARPTAHAAQVDEDLSPEDRKRNQRLRELGRK
jgi:hypothetical protein